MKRLCLAATCVALLAAAAPASANHSWGGYHWARTTTSTTTTFTIGLGDNVGQAWGQYLGVLSSDWSFAASGLDPVLNENFANPVRTQTFTGGIDPKKCRPQSGKIEVCAASYGRNGWLGLASIWASGSHITQATTKLNDSYFGIGSSYNTPAWRQMVSCQEVGHDFGLDHQDEVFANTNLGTCMDYTNQPGGGTQGGSNEHPNTHDYGELSHIYAHNDGSTTIAAVPAPSVPASSGSGLRKVRDDLYVEDLGNGNRRFVWVLWSQQVPHGPPADA